MKRHLEEEAHADESIKKRMREGFSRLKRKFVGGEEVENDDKKRVCITPGKLQREAFFQYFAEVYNTYFDPTQEVAFSVSCDENKDFYVF